MGETRFRAFGPTRVLDLHPAQIGGQRERALLAALLLHPAQHQPIDRLAEIIWPGEQPSDPVHAVRSLVMRLRRHLPSGTISTSNGGYLISASEEDVDVNCFERLLDEARMLAEFGRFDTASQRYRAALRLAEKGKAWEDLIGSRLGRAASLRISELRYEAEERCTELEERIGLPTIGRWRQLATEQPLRESRWCLLMGALYRGGRQSEALRTFAIARSILKNEIGVDPGPELLDLERRVLAHEPLTVP